MIWRPFWIFLKNVFVINGKLGNINSEFFYRLEKLNLRRTLGERKMSDFPSGVWERGKSKGWNWVFRLLGIFWMWILPESATGTSKGFAPKINSVRFFIVKHTSLARPFWQSLSERNVSDLATMVIFTYSLKVFELSPLPRWFICIFVISLESLWTFTFAKMRPVRQRSTATVASGRWLS